MTEEKFNEIAEELRNSGYNFVLVLEKENDIYSQTSVTTDSKLKNIQKETIKASVKLSKIGRGLVFPGQIEIK